MSYPPTLDLSVDFSTSSKHLKMPDIDRGLEQIGKNLNNVQEVIQGIGDSYKKISNLFKPLCDSNRLIRDLLVDDLAYQERQQSEARALGDAERFEKAIDRMAASESVILEIDDDLEKMCGKKPVSTPSFGP